MIYSTLLREIQQRIRFHMGESLLKGMKLSKAGEIRTDGDKDLPMLTMIDLVANDRAGKTTGTISMWLRTRRKDDWLKTSDDGKPGLWDWTERILDALETMPSSPAAALPDQRFVQHTTDGAVVTFNGSPVELLSEPFTVDVRMAEITDLTFLLQIDLTFALPGKKTARRRTTPQTTCT